MDDRGGSPEATIPTSEKLIRGAIAREEAKIAASSERSRRPEPLTSATPAPVTSAEKLALFRSLFRGREDIYPRFWSNARTGRKGYAPACANEWVPGVCEKPRVKCGEWRACEREARLWW